SYFARFSLVHIGGPSSNQTATLESQVTQGIQYLSRRTLKSGEEGRREPRNLFSSTELQHAVMEANLADPSNAAKVMPHASVNDLAPHTWRPGKPRPGKNLNWRAT
ncbi:MAG: hypothetical protein ACREC4_10025, partial [Methylocella sp.]